MHGIEWLNEPEEHNYTGAASYLDLLYNDSAPLIRRFKAAGMSVFRVNDIFRASKSIILPKDNHKVKEITSKIVGRIPLSPVLLIKHPVSTIIADGYHRLCAVYYFNEFSLVRCKILNQ